jgi:hypothetical protein
MKNKIILLILSFLGSLTCWIIIDLFVVELQIWQYLLIELLIVLTKMLYEKEKKRLNG